MRQARRRREPEADQRLLRRLQLTEGLLWLHAARGDPYARLLCGLPGGEPERLRERGPLWRAATGDWLVTDHAGAARATAGGHVVPTTPFDLPADPPGAPTPPAPDLGTLPDRGDLAAVVRRDVVRVLAGGDAGTAALLADVEPAVDAALRAPAPVPAVRLAEAGAELSERTDRPLLAATGVRLATTLVLNAVAALLGAGGWSRLAAEPGFAARVVTETWRYAPPLRLWPARVEAAPAWGRGLLAPGDRMVVVLATANRDGTVFADPDRFDPDRPAAPVLTPGGPWAGPVGFARWYAEALLPRLAAAAPGLRPDGSPVRPGRAPVTGTAVRFPVRVI
ncbi:hypothetical protein [Micromonospora robiginosa]|uniref:Cytochrome P450 n=1 Tax=Micromonospora robiginosa TaxID=2749844 RepID=A0AAF0P2S0_9ACTN|nr:hypothetical protein [Micromonospora ferruginea]WMF04489.1 hypothetical protein H1D33_30115 [Micromonospora ferruginea]